jgi:hypothetical protein
MRDFRAKHLPIKADRTRQVFCPDNIFQFLDAHVSASRKSGRTATHNADNAKRSLVAATVLPKSNVYRVENTWPQGIKRNSPLGAVATARFAKWRPNAGERRQRQTPLTPFRPFQSTFPRLETHMPHRTLLFLGLTGLFLVSAALADQLKKEVHSQADLPRATYPVTGSVSTLLQSDDSVFDSTVSKAAADLDALFSDYDIKDNATLISILSAKLSLQELKGDAAGGLQTIKRIRELQSKPDLKLTVGLFDEAILKA